MRATKAFRAHILDGAAEIWFSDKRLIFWENGAPRLNPKTGKPDAALFDSILVVFAPTKALYAPVVGVWQAPSYALQGAPRKAIA